jgi:hypothetical protein
MQRIALTKGAQIWINLAWEVSDGERTIYVVRGKVVIEKREGPTSVWAALGTFFPECRFCSQHLPSGQEGGAVAVNVRARLPSPGPSQLSDSSSRRRGRCR